MVDTFQTWTHIAYLQNLIQCFMVREKFGQDDFYELILSAKHKEE